jgi:hypothetical protein
VILLVCLFVHSILLPPIDNFGLNVVITDTELQNYDGGKIKITSS